MMPDQESAWLRAAQAGDTEAYELLQLHLEPEVRRFVQRLIQHAESVDDIVQEVFIAFYQHRQQIDPATLRPYLFRIARNRCYDDLRRLGRHDEYSLDDEPVEWQVAFTQAHTQPRPDDLAHWMLLALEVREAIDQLPEAQRQTLILYSEEGLTYSEIAAILDVSIGTVKSRLFYAKKALRGLLRPATLEILHEEFDPPARALPQPGTPEQPLELTTTDG